MITWPAAVLFDFDGVIVDSEPLHFTAFASTLWEEKIELGKEEYYRELIGFDDRGAFEYLYRKHGRELDGPTFARLMRRKGELARELMWAGKFSALPGVDELVPGLAKRYPLAICSGARRGEIEMMLGGIGLAEFFPIIVAAEDVLVGKPDPSGYLLAARLVGERVGREIGAGDCLVVEDSPLVAAAVRKVGFRVLGVTTSHGREDFGGVEWVVDSLEPGEVRVVEELLGELMQRPTSNIEHPTSK